MAATGGDTEMLIAMIAERWLFLFLVAFAVVGALPWRSR